MTASIRLGAVSLDCSDPRELAGFYSRMTGSPVAFESDDFVAMAGDIWLTAVRVEGYQRPTWPGPDVAKQAHLDFAVDDLDGAQQVAAELGATIVEDQPSPDRWRVMLDPAGHPFCLTTQLPS